MKTAILLLSLPVMILASCTKEKILGSNDLPAVSAGFIAANFPDQPVVHAVKEYDNLKIEYFVYLKSGVKIVFNHSGEVQEIDSNTAIPQKVIPVSILNYVNDQYPADFICKWKTERSLQFVTLSTGIVLEFDKNGNFLRISN